jgi:hypothetical protein
MDFLKSIFNTETKNAEVVKIKEGKNYNEKREIIITELERGLHTFTIYVNEGQYNKYLKNIITLTSREPVLSENTHKYLLSSGKHKFYVMTTIGMILTCLNPEIDLKYNENAMKRNMGGMSKVASKDKSKSKVTSDEIELEMNPCYRPMSVSQFFSEQ